jgi:WD40 repeat protein
MASDEIVWTQTGAGPVSSLAFNPEGTRLMTASPAGNIQVWAASSGARLFTLPTPSDTVSSVAFSTDGTHLAMAHSDGTVSIYPLELEDLLALAQSQVTRTLTPEECRKYVHVEQCPG